MMPHFILIVVVFCSNSYSASVSVNGFYTPKACEAAQGSIVKDFEAYLNTYYSYCRVVHRRCHYSGERPDVAK